jgi:hypothetical protein
MVAVRPFLDGSLELNTRQKITVVLPPASRETSVAGWPLDQPDIRVEQGTSV